MPVGFETRHVAVKLLCCPPVAVERLCARRSLANGEVEVWKFASGSEQGFLHDLKCLLSDDELRRAARFRFQKDRHRFVASRGILRSLLAGYLGRSPRSMEFHYSDTGKPLLPATSDLHFNVAHSGELIVWAFAQGRRVGIDVEEIRIDFPTQEIAERFFSASERSTLRMLAPNHRPQAFFRCWTRKEAFVKATGDGLSLPLDQFDVTLAPGQPAELVQTRPDYQEAERWTMHNLDVHPNYAAALVTERQVFSER